jgi:hypothetical protein
LNVVVIDQFASVSGGFPLLHFAHEPLIVVHHAFHHVNYKLFGLSALLGGELGPVWLAGRG